MPAATIVIGVLLILLGVLPWLAMGPEAKTALIASAFGLLLAIAGLAGLKPNWRKHAMHVAAALALLGVIGNIGAVFTTVQLLGGAEGESIAPYVRSGMAVICLVLVVLAVRSFIMARRKPAE